MIDKKNRITNRTTKKQIMDMELELSDSLKKCSKKLRDDKDVVIKFVENWGENIEYASVRLRDDEEVVKAAITKSYGVSIFEYASSRIKNDPEIVKLAVQYRAISFLYASDELRKNKKFILELVKLYGIEPIWFCYDTTNSEIYQRLKTPAIQVLEAMIEEENK